MENQCVHLELCVDAQSLLLSCLTKETKLDRVQMVPTLGQLSLFLFALNKCFILD